VAIPFPREYAELTPAPDVLLGAAERTGGGRLPEDAQLFHARGRLAAVVEERWPWLVWCALVLFLADVAARRLLRRSRAPSARTYR
jgi:hypothetical protein